MKIRYNVFRDLYTNKWWSSTAILSNGKQRFGFSTECNRNESAWYLCILRQTRFSVFQVFFLLKLYDAIHSIINMLRQKI